VKLESTMTSLLLAIVLGAGSLGAEGPPKDVIEGAVSHPDRPAADRGRDAARKPGGVLAFAGIAPGMKVADLMTGGGWYAELISRVVGSTGTVYAHNSAFVANKPYGAHLAKRLSEGRLPNVIPIEEEIDDLSSLPKGALDAVTLVLFYHDTYWMKIDRKAMNEAIFSALEPGGVFLVVDHASVDGAGDKEVKRLHRVEEAMVVKEVLEAGFLLEATSDLLRNPADDGSTNVFKPAIRGQTDRFVLRFRRPVSNTNPAGQ
jgi:predicted methyltransferase